MAVATDAQPKYPTARRVLSAQLDGTKRRRVLAVIAAFLDEEHAPSLREIAERAGLDGWEQARHLVKRLEADGLLAVKWAPRAAQRRYGARNRYRVLI